MNKKKVLKIAAAFIFPFSATVIASCGNAGHVIAPNKVVTGFYIEGITGPIEVGKFFESNICIRLVYDDDTSETVPVTESMFTAEELEVLNTPGTHSVTVSFRGNETTIYVRIVSAKTYTVKFYESGENGDYHETSTQTVAENEDAVAPEAVQDIYRGGYHYSFTGWDQVFTNVTANMEVYATYSSIEYYDVVFKNGALNDICWQKVDLGSAAIEPNEQERSMSGYRFVGWNRSYNNITANTEVLGLYVSDHITSYEEHQTFIYGEYPQTKVMSSVLKSILDGLETNEYGYVEYHGSEYLEEGDEFYKVEPVEWIVLNEESTSKLAITKRVIEYYHGENQVDVTNWMNQTLFNNMFLKKNTLEESDQNHPSNKILTTELITVDDEYEGKLFLPSAEEKNMFHSISDSLTECSDYAHSHDNCGVKFHGYEGYLGRDTNRANNDIKQTYPTWEYVSNWGWDYWYDGPEGIRPCINIVL